MPRRALAGTAVRGLGQWRPRRAWAWKDRGELRQGRPRATPARAAAGKFWQRTPWLARARTVARGLGGRRHRPPRFDAAYDETAAAAAHARTRIQAKSLVPANLVNTAVPQFFVFPKLCVVCVSRPRAAHPDRGLFCKMHRPRQPDSGTHILVLLLNQH